MGGVSLPRRRSPRDGVRIRRTLSQCWGPSRSGVLRGAPSFSGAERRSLGEGVREGGDAQRGAVAVVACEASLSRAPASWRAASAGVLDWEGLRQMGRRRGCCVRTPRVVACVLERAPREVSTFFFEKEFREKKFLAGPLAASFVFVGKNFSPTMVPEACCQRGLYRCIRHMPGKCSSSAAVRQLAHSSCPFRLGCLRW